MPTRKQLSLLASSALVSLGTAVTGLTVGDYEEVSNALYGGGLIAGLVAVLAAVTAAADRRDRVARSRCRAAQVAHVVRELQSVPDSEERRRRAKDELDEARGDLEALLDSGDCTRAAELRDAIEELEAAAGLRKHP